MKTFVKISFFFFLLPILSGQSPLFKIHNFTADYPDIAISKILETKEGYLWFASSEGLFRYDGQDFEQIKNPKADHVLDITALYEKQTGEILIGTSDGEIWILNENNELHHWEAAKEIKESAILDFAETQDSTFWISTYGEGLFYYKNNSLHTISGQDGLSALEIYTMVALNGNKVALGTDAGIDICSLQGEQINIQSLSTNDGLADEIVKTLLPDHHGNLWIGTYDKGISYWRQKENTFEIMFADWDHGVVNALALFQDKELWIGTEDNGLFRYDLHQEELMSITEEKFKDSKIQDLHKDIEGNLWVINNTFGIASANRQFEQISHNLGNVQAVLIDQENWIWLGTADGLFRMKNKDIGKIDFQRYPIGEKINVISLYQDGFENIWIGTFGQGLFCIEASTKKLRKFKAKDGLSNENILSIDGTGNQVWLATLGGAIEFTTREKISSTQFLQFKSHASNLGTNFIFTVFVDSQKRVWFGTDGKGISVWDKGEIKNYQKANTLPLKSVYSITEDHHGHIWLSTLDQGIFEFDGKQFSQFTLEEGLRNLEITGLSTDGAGNILVAHDSGVDLINPETRSLSHYDDELGLNDIELGINAMTKDELGNVWIGANNQLIKFSIFQEAFEHQPRIRINRVNVFFEPIDHYKINNFSYNQNNLVFEYSGLWYTDPNKLSYRYQLEGYDILWIRTKDRQAHYSNLPAGDYVFKVSATANTNFNDEVVDSYHFTIKAAIWQQFWFWGIVFLLTIASIYVWMKWREKQLQRRNNIKKERIESQLEVLKNQINPHFLFNSFNTLISLIETDAPAAARYTESLSDFYRSILQYRKKHLISLKEEFELVKNYEKILKERFGENINLKIPNINRQKAFIAPLTLQILVENAIKHNIISKAKPLTIDLKVDQEYICVINNLQKKLTKEKSTRFGLQGIKTKYKLLDHGEIQIEETDDYFKVVIPIIKSQRI